MIDKSELFNDITYLYENHSVHRKSCYWSVDDNYVITKNNTIPVRATAISDIFFLSLHTLVLEKNEQCNSNDGYKIILHHPADIPTLLFQQSVPIALSSNYKILIRPEVTVTSDNLKKYDPHRRHCFYSRERSLKFFKTYTKHNCKIECLANYTLSECHCVPYFLPHEKSTTICSLVDASCASNCEKHMFHMDMEAEIDDEGPNILRVCDCLPLCTLINYNTQVHHNKVGRVPGQPLSRSEVEIGYKEMEFPIMERQELFSNADFWANCGGLLGLFTGFSVVSLAEIIYYLSIRWICDLCCFGERILRKRDH
ncbi:pickpocket protein 28-like [Zophobas morio]